ncbi:MAG: hypothetical protein Q9225_000276 [Loekoesia sp. 1 TL-2023]
MGDLSSSRNIEVTCNSAATLGLENLKLGNENLGLRTSQMPRNKKKAVGKAPAIVSKDGSSKEAASRWCHDPQAPDYRPLNVPPLGSTQDTISQSSSSLEAIRHELPSHPNGVGHQKPYPVAERSLPSKTPPSRGAPNQTKQSVLYRPEVPRWRIDKLYRYSNSRAPSSVPLVVTTPSQPLGRWFGSAPALQRNSKSPSVRSSSPGYTVKPPPTPIPDAAYITQSTIPATKLPSPQPLLLVLDLNGTLLYRPKSSTAYKPRPSLQSFLAHCVSNYQVLVWSSATPPNVTAICSKIFTPGQRKLLLGEWGRDTLDLTPQQYNAKVQVYKRLDRIWVHDRIQRAHPDFASGGRWSQKNTLLLDDSALKSSAQPYNGVVVPEFVRGGGKEQKDGTEVLGQVVAYLEMARTFDNVSSFVRKRPFRVNEGWKWDWDLKGPPVVDLTGESDEETGGVTLPGMVTS